MDPKISQVIMKYFYLADILAWTESVV